MKLLIVSVALLLFADTTPRVVEPAVKINVPAPYPCNLSPHPIGGVALAVCITGDEVRDTCSDKSRVLLRREDGESICVKFELIDAAITNAAQQGSTGARNVK